MKKLYTSTSQIDVSLLEGILKDNGIEPLIKYTGAGDYFNIKGGDLGYEKEMWVPEQDYEKAINLMEENNFTKATNPTSDSKTLSPKVIFARIILATIGIVALMYICLQLLM